VRTAFLATAIGLSVVSLAAADPASAAIRKHTDIPAQDLSSALRQFAKDRDLHLVYISEDLRERRSPGAAGDLTASEALTTLLSGTDLTYRYLDEETVTIVPFASKQAPSDSRSASQADTTNPSPSTGEDRGEDEKPAQRPKALELEEIVVTGSHIRGATAAGANLIVIDRQAIDASGYGRVEDVLATLTQNFKGVSEESPGSGFNQNRGAEVQLRGLGPGTTLLLVNGQRQALGGGVGSMTDISSIAVSAIERIEILPDGASALYGSDAIGGVVNVILRKDFDGMETRVRLSTAGGEAEQRLFSQLWGHAWSRGHALVGYQYNERESLLAIDREYSAANADFRRFGGSDSRGVQSSPGTITISGQRYAIPSAQDGTNLTFAQLIPGTVNYRDYVTFVPLLPEQKTHSGFMHVSYEVADRWELSVDGRYAVRTPESFERQFPSDFTVPANNAFNRMGGPVVVAYDFTRDLGPKRVWGTAETFFTSAGVTGALPGGWQLKMSGAYAKERNAYHVENGLNFSPINSLLNNNDPATALNLFGDGSGNSAATLAAIIAVPYTEAAFWTTSSATALVEGPLFDLPAGAVRLAFGGDYRKEHIIQYSTLAARRNVSGDTVAFFTELAVPVLNTLELSLAGRYEDYSKFGTTFDPKVGLSWRPWDFVKLRGTWGTSFKAPPFYASDPQFRSTSSLSLRSQNVRDPLSTATNGMSQVLVINGIHPDLKEETADVWTAGINLTPTEDLALSFTFFDIEYDGKILTPGSGSTFLTQESAHAELITRNPTAAQIAEVCSNPRFSGSCVGPFAAILDTRTRNLSGVKTRGLDTELSYSLPTSSGRWGSGLRGTYTFDYKRQLTSTAPVLELVDTFNNPLALRLSGDLSWGLRGWSARATVNYTGGYKYPGATQTSKVDSWTTLDLNLGYRIEAGESWLRDTQVHLGASNVLDAEPPFVDVFDLYVFGYDYANSNILGRQLSLQVVKAW
jgi:iron complex outermembrane recepter protein